MGGKVTSYYKNQLKTQLYDKTLQTFINEKESWAQQTFDTFNWFASGTTFKQL
jgi:hypothetical protein